MKIYVSCLASYNNGVLHGAWIDVSSDMDEMQGQINNMLRASRFPNVAVQCPECDGAGADGTGNPYPCPSCKGTGEAPSAEEWAIHDYEGMPSSFGEYTGLQTIADYAELCDDMEFDSDFVQALVDHCCGDLDRARQMMTDYFAGMYASWDEYVDEFVHDCVFSGDANETLQRYFDHEAFGRDLRMDYEVLEISWDTVAVFHNN